MMSLRRVGDSRTARRAAVLGLIAGLGAMLGLLAGHPPAQASTTHDLRGTFTIDVCPGQVSGTCTVNNFPQTWTVATEESGSGAVAGTGAGTGTGNNTQRFTLSGAISADSLDLTLVEGSYSSHVTATISADSNSFNGTYTDSNHGAGVVTGTRASGPPPPPAPPPTTSTTPTTPPASCTNPTTLLVTCASTLPEPGVCNPTGTVFPACNMPAPLPTVCGPVGTGLPACQSPANYVVACGSLGTSLPQCNLPPPPIPHVCGPSGTGLPPCSGANNPITVCGPPGSGLAACSFSSSITAPPLEAGSGGSVEASVNCVSSDASAASAAAANDRAIAFQARVCPGAGQIVALRNAHFTALVEMARDLSADYATSAPQVTRTMSPIAELVSQATRNAAAFVTRTGDAANEFLTLPDSSGKVHGPMSGGDNESALGILSLRGGAPAYEGPDELFGNVQTQGANAQIVGALDAAVAEYAELVNPAAKAGSAAVHSAVAATAPGSVVYRFTVKASRRRTRLRFRLSRGEVGQLIRSAGAAKVVPLRVVVAFNAKPRPVVRFIDIAVRIKRHHKR
jgi:hypothetical protein